MSDLLYSTFVSLGRPVMWVCSRAVEIGAEYTVREGGCLIAANHSSPYDIPILMRHVRRRVDFVSNVEVFQNPVVATFYRGMNAFPLDRSRRDTGAVREIVRRFKAGRVVGLFPEGRFRKDDDSVLRGGKLVKGIGRLAAMTGVPVVPAAIWGAEGFGRLTSWLPVRGVRYGVAFGEAIVVGGAGEMEERLAEEIRRLHVGLQRRLQGEAPGGREGAGVGR